jgi:hypothetical protein
MRINNLELSGAMGVEGFQPRRRTRPFNTKQQSLLLAGERRVFGEYKPPETCRPVF